MLVNYEILSRVEILPTFSVLYFNKITSKIIKQMVIIVFKFPFFTSLDDVSDFLGYCRFQLKIYNFRCNKRCNNIADLWSQTRPPLITKISFLENWRFSDAASKKRLQILVYLNNMIRKEIVFDAIKDERLLLIRWCFFNIKF